NRNRPHCDTTSGWPWLRLDWRHAPFADQHRVEYVGPDFFLPRWFTDTGNSRAQKRSAADSHFDWRYDRRCNGGRPMKRAEAGYALIEMLATLVIIGMMSAMMISGLGASQQVWKRVDAANSMGDNMAGAQLLLRGRLERVFPATRYDKIPSYADFDGLADKMM